MADLWFQTFEAAQSNGTLPNDFLASAMRYRKAIFWQVDLFGFGIGSKTKTGEWNVTLSTFDDATIYFQQKVGLSLMLVSLSAPGLSLFTWNVINGAAGEKYETTVVGGTPTTPENIGEFLQGGTALSEQGIAIPASGNESTNFTASIQFDYFSPIYLFKNRALPANQKVKVSVDSWGIGTANSTYAWAFDAAQKPFAILDRHGAIRSLIPEEKGVRLRHTYGGPNQRIHRAAIPDGTEAAMWKDETNRLFAMVRAGERGDRRNLIYYSDLEGMDTKPLLYGRGHDLEGKQVEFWKGDKYQSISVPVPTARGEVLLCAQLGPDLFFMRAPNVYTAGPITKVGKNAGRPCQVVYNEKVSDRIVIVDEKTLQFESNDGGTSWKDKSA